MKISFNFIYTDLVIGKADIIHVYLAYLVSEAGKIAPQSAKVIFPEDYCYDEALNIIHIKALGMRAVNELNDKVSRELEIMLQKNFGLAVKIFFENHILHFEATKGEIDDKNHQTILETPKRSMPKLAASKATSKISVKGMILGKKISEDPIKIQSLSNQSDYVVVQGKIFTILSRAIKNSKLLISLIINDFTSSICIKLFINNEKGKDLLESLKEGDSIKVRGNLEFDNFENSLVIMAKDIEEIIIEKRSDNSIIKRVELHAHTKMSSMDGLCETKELIKTAAEWGHKAVAITDHGVLQAFPDAMVGAKDLKNSIKIIYGVEAYIINDQEETYQYPKELSIEDEYVAFDLETTGLYARENEIIEIGAVKILKGEIIDKFSSFLCPVVKPIPKRITELTGITNEMVKDHTNRPQLLENFKSFIGDLPLVAHNSSFDMAFLKTAFEKSGLPVENNNLDTLYLSRLLVKETKDHKLNTLAKHFGIDQRNHHRALDDAGTCAKILNNLFEKLKDNGVFYINDIEKLARKNIEYKNIETYHAIILVKNYQGLKNLYKLISMAHLQYFYKKPRIPKSLLTEYRDGLLLGSACEAGEVFQGILNRKSDEDVDKIIDFYDYLEIQPLINNDFLIANERLKDKDELIDINMKIIDMAKNKGKLVVGTCDVHYIEQEDSIYRKILMAGQGYKDIEGDKGLYFRTTEEMMEEFAYLNKELTQEIVVTNTNLIADMIDVILPGPDGVFAPSIEGSEEILRDICEKTAKERYGDILPEIVEKRLSRELDSIITHGYAVMYVVAEMLVKKSMEDGYLVGSRGSVGSSFAATMSGITEVNPLPPHYICPKCKFSDFSNSENSGCGIDMKDLDCPICSEKMIKDGFDIPFEVFLGFDCDKEPDIDLNFASEYQSVAHKYTETIFGKDHVFRAGTIGTIASKTAYGFVKKYFDERGEITSKWEVERLTKSCTGVRRTTGQHPGGVMIVPEDKEIYDFCPIQFPANDESSNVITTHFDYHSISGRLLKLDILGHDVPTMIKMLQDLTGVDPLKVPLKDEKVDSIFTTTKGLNLHIKNYRYSNGTFGIPEFGTKFVRQMLEATKPNAFSDLIRISGLSHGTNVWINNAQELIASNTAVLKDVISTRDDIMNYLIGKGVENKIAFKIFKWI